MAFVGFGLLVMISVSEDKDLRKLVAGVWQCFPEQEEEWEEESGAERDARPLGVMERLPPFWQTGGRAPFLTLTELISFVSENFKIILMMM